MEYQHKTKSGKLINLYELEDYHLDNIINLIDRKAKEGMEMRDGGIGAGEPWYDEWTIYGDDVRNELNYDAYISERKRRKSPNA